MRAIITLIFTLSTIVTFGQWDVIHASGNNGGHRDLYFLNNDTGFVIGSGYNDSGWDGSYILRTHDGGLTWDSLTYHGHKFRTIFMTSADTGYIASFYLPNFPSADVMRTVNGGDSWEHIAFTIANANGVPYAISFFNNDTGIVNMQNYNAMTFDAGVTWTQLNNFEGGYRDGDIGEATFIEMGGTLIAWSSDFGNTFTFDTLSYQGSHYFLEAKDHRFISSAIGSDGQALGYPNNSFGIITRGNVISQEWNISYFPFLSRVFDLSWPSENIMYAVHNLYYTESPEEIKFFMKSVDGGETWYRQETTEPYYYGTQDIFCPSDSVCYAVGGNNAYIYKTTNGGGPLLDEVEQIVLSVKEIEDDHNFSIAPNPTSGQVIVNSEKEKIKEVKIFDLQGKQLLQSYPNDFNAHIDLSKFDSGIYLIQIMAGDKIRTGKIVRE